MILENEAVDAGADISQVSFGDLRKMMNGEEVTPEPAKVKEPSEVAEPVKPATESIAAESDPAETEETEAPAKSGNLEKRFSKLTKTIRDLEAENATLKAGKGTEVKQAVTTPEPAKETSAPKQEDFPDWEAYEDARLEYKLTQREAAKAKTEADRVAQTEATAVRERVAKQTKKAMDDHADFEAVALNPELSVSSVMAHVLQSSDNGAELLYALGKAPELAAKIAAMSPGQAALALGRLEAKLFPDESPKPAVTAPAPKVLPKPPSTVGATAPGAKALSDEQPYSEWKSQFNREVLGRK